MNCLFYCVGVRWAHCKAIADGARHVKNAQHIKKDNDELPLAIVIGAQHIKNVKSVD